jgi:broad specificity phosphatase PhoE
MILLRHGQSEFNLHFGATRRDPGIVDPKLTDLGHRQAEGAIERLAAERISRIVVSPYTRTLQTARPIARALRVPVVVNPIVRERYGFACDIGTPRSKLALAWEEHDFSHIEEIWWPSADESAESIRARASLFRAEMAALPDWSDTLVVSHWGFILCMTGQSIANGQSMRCDPTMTEPEELVWRA